MKIFFACLIGAVLVGCACNSCPAIHGDAGVQVQSGSVVTGR